MISGQKIKQARKAAMMTQTQAAKALDLSVFYYQLYERGEMEPPVSVCVRMAKLFGVDISWFADSDGSFLHLPVYLGKGATAPRKAADGAGFEIFAPRNIYIRPKSSVTVDTGVRLALPASYYAAVSSLPALSERYGIIADGIYTAASGGNIKLQLINHGDNGYLAASGTKLALLYVLPCCLTELEKAACE